MSVKKNKVSCYRCFDEIWNQRDLEVIPELISENYVGRSAQETKGHQGFRQSVISQVVALPDLHYSVDDVFGEEDKLAIFLTLTGTFTGKMEDIEPTGNHVKFHFSLCNRYEDGKCVESVAYGDWGDFYRQLGVPVAAGVS